MEIAFDHLQRTFGTTRAVHDFTATITEPTMLGVIGPSGAGKSTLLRMINRLTDATGGRLMIDGTDVLTLKGAAKRRWQRDCAMIFQQFNLVPRLDVITNVALGRLNGMNLVPSLFALFKPADIEAGLAALERLGIADQALKRA
ncbi:MAG: ATP-binding cassette domain-containing protein, partial [Pseudomonadota bacterium]